MLILLLAHFIVNFLGQTHYEAYEKLTDIYVRIEYSLKYGVVMSFMSLILARRDLINAGTTLLVTVYLITSHFIIDTPAVKRWIANHTRYRDYHREYDMDEEWWHIVVDQVLHILALVPVIAIMGISGAW